MTEPLATRVEEALQAWQQLRASVVAPEILDTTRAGEGGAQYGVGVDRV